MSQGSLQPRKTPVQARSAASVEAMLEAALQVLVAVGKERLTTTLVAQRAGVSVGTLYQYFPNKRALLQACLRRHMDQVTGAIEEACARSRGMRLEAMGTAVMEAYLRAKMADGRESQSLYAVSVDVDGTAIAAAAMARSRRCLAELLVTAEEGLGKDAEVVALVVAGMLHGLSRQLLEGRMRAAEVKVLRAEVAVAVQAYLATCAGRAAGGA